MLQPAEILNQLIDEIQKIKDDAVQEGTFYFELVNQVRLQSVLRTLKAEMDRSPSGEVYDLLGRVYCLRKDEQKCREYHLKSIEMEPGIGARFFDYAVSLEKFNHNIESIKHYKTAVSLDPVNIVAWNYLLNNLIILEKFKEAIDVMDEIIKRQNTQENLEKREQLLELYYPPEEEISDELIDAVRKSEEDIKAGRFTECKTEKESDAFFNSVMGG